MAKYDVRVRYTFEGTYKVWYWAAISTLPATMTR